MKRIITVLLSVILCLSLVGCNGDSADYTERTFFVMDTAFTLRIYQPDERAEQHFSAVLTLLGEIDGVLSKTNAQSDVSRINRERSAGALSPHTEAVLRVALDVMQKSNGAYLPTMGALTALWQEAGENDCLPDEVALSSALADARLGFTLENGVCSLLGESALLDLGGVGKGYAADCVLAYLREQQVRGALLSFGSSVATMGEKGDGQPFKISLRHPRSASDTVGTLTDPIGVLSVSGDYERYVTVGGVNYHHILNPDNGYPTDSGLASVAVLCESGAYSDALSTACMVLGQAAGAALCAAFSADAIFVDGNGATVTVGAPQFIGK
ncbi:MAG: FAD:protein FMN transferase [Ruminococcaceae bacterium]|nr:FAD:protein FMN transferase [Oscillospiraceae bacterium]